MTQPIAISDAGEITRPALHDAKSQGLLLAPNCRLLMPIETNNGIKYCLVFQGVERLRADDFRQGNTILDVTVTSGASINLEDVAYAYGLEPSMSVFLQKTMERLIREDRVVARVNPSYGCTLVCICSEIETEDDLLAALRAS
ncbi:MAG: hypothetical protein M0Q15_08640 [Nevskia sp.]|jgi:hypothetical protein|nr:hypothetical protein [Nevskia sp.]